MGTKVSYFTDVKNEIHQHALAEVPINAVLQEVNIRNRAPA
ncbi:hypothetical protein P4T89_05490 [Bacillus nakamurai]|nr:hypothetical protein [Bacillus nakamurai]MED1227070.1 hypothetical protein [Bacillus nakamurai]